MRLALCILSLLAGTAAAQPACTAAPGPLQAMICAEPALREAEQRLRGLERALATTTTRPATTQHRAGAWQSGLAAPGTGQPFTPEMLQAQLDERIAEVEETLRQDRAMPRQAMARPPALDRLCLGTALRNCRVAATGLVISEDGRARILWQSQRGFSEWDGTRAGIILLAEQRGGWRPIAWAFDGVSYEAPRLIPQEGGLLLAVPGRLGGSGGGNADLLLRLSPAGWREVELESWMASLPARLPAGLGIGQAVTYDFEAMRARTRLWRDTDANCCPTGGGARLDFRIERDALVLTEIRLDAP